jgi:Rod binding domain-containing protein
MNGFNIGALHFEQRRDVQSLQRQAEGMRGGGIDRSSRLYKVCQDFEAIFIKQMLNVMRKTIHKTGLTDGGMAEEIFEDMLYDEYALKMAKSRQFGISDMLYRELDRTRHPAV